MSNLDDKGKLDDKAKEYITYITEIIKKLIPFFTICFYTEKMSIKPDELWQLKMGNDILTNRLENHGIKPLEMEKVKDGLKNLNEEHYQLLRQLLTRKYTQNNFKEVLQLLADMLKNLQKATEHLQKREYKKIFDLLITVKAGLEFLREKFDINTKETETRLWVLERLFKDEKII